MATEYRLPWTASEVKAKLQKVDELPTKDYVNTEVETQLSALVNAAPDTLNTLDELAAALGDDPNFATTVATQIGTKVSKSGDTMTGSLLIEKDKGYFAVKHVSDGSGAAYGTSGHNARILLQDSFGDTTKGRIFYVHDAVAKSDINEALQLADVVDSKQTVYNVLHTGNIDKIARRLDNRGTVIPDNSDLNTYTTPGNFYVPASTNAATIANTPMQGAGYRLIVSQEYGGAALISQTAIGNIYATQFYRCGQYNSSTEVWTWQPWEEIAVVSKMVKKSGDTITGTLNTNGLITNAFQQHSNYYGTPIEIGQYIDMHLSGSNTDYDGRLYLGKGKSLCYAKANVGQWEILHTGNKNLIAPADIGAATTATVTTTAAGLMSAADKTKLDGIAAGANNYSLPNATASVLGGVKIGSNITVSTGTISLTKANVTSALGYTPPTASAATQSTAGLMSAADKAKLDGIATGATANTGDITGVTAGTGLSGGGASGSVTLALAASGVTAGSYGPTANVSGSNGATISVPQITVDTYGRVTSVVNRTYTSVNTDTNTDTKNTAGSTNTTSKIFLIGATSQAANPQTYSNSACYVTNGVLTATQVKGAVYNDYAEYRHTNVKIEPGRVVIENGDDTLTLSNGRLQPGGNIVSDTFGFSIGQTEICNTPIAVSGRVLAYPYEDRESYKAGDAVCTGPNGTVSKMTREEIMKYPERIIGTVSAIPNYDIWGSNEIKVNNRIWIKIK